MNYETENRNVGEGNSLKLGLLRVFDNSINSPRRLVVSPKSVEAVKSSAFDDNYFAALSNDNNIEYFDPHERAEFSWAAPTAGHKFLCARSSRATVLSVIVFICFSCLLAIVATSRKGDPANIEKFATWWNKDTWVYGNDNATLGQSVNGDGSIQSEILSWLPSMTSKDFAKIELDDKMCHVYSPMSKGQRCLGPPYIYLTYHGGYGRNRVKNVCRYSRNGCSLGSVSLPDFRKMGSGRPYVPHAMRGMMLHKGYLYVAEAWKEDSRVIQFSPCLKVDQLEGKREVLRILIDSHNEHVSESFEESSNNATDNTNSQTEMSMAASLSYLDLPSSSSSSSSSNMSAGQRLRVTDGKSRRQQSWMTRQKNGMIHPYGFARAPHDPYLYVSSQGSFAVLRYNPDTGAAGPVSPGAIWTYMIKDLKSRNREKSLDFKSSNENQSISLFNFSSTFNSLGAKQMYRVARRYGSDAEILDAYHRIKKRKSRLFAGVFVDLLGHAIRGITFDSRGRLFVADKVDGVRVYDSKGFLIEKGLAEIPSPISLYVCTSRQSLWVGSSTTHELYELSLDTLKLIQTLSSNLLKHPAGLVSYESDLFVVSQETNKLLKFSMSKGSFEGVVLQDLPDAGERLLMSPC